MLFREETDAALSTVPPSLKEEARSTGECWMEVEEMDVLEGDLDSFTDDREAAEFPLTDFSTAESREDVEEDREEACWVGVSSAEVQEEEALRRGAGSPSSACFSSFTFEDLCVGEPEDAAGGGDCAVEGELGSAEGEEGDEV